MSTLFITGANRGLGLEWVRQMSDAGWRVLATYRNPATSEELLGLARERPQSVAAHPLDVTDFEAIDRLAQDLSGETIDVVVNNAGVLPSRKPFGKTDYDEWARLMRNNLFSYMKVAEAFAPHLARSPRSVMMCMTSGLSSLSVAGSRGAGQRFGDGKHAYRTTKAAVNMLARCLAGYLHDQGTIVVSVTPGWARTDMGLSDLDPGYSADALVDPVDSVRGMRKLIETLTPEDSGSLLRWDGSILPW